MESRQSDALRRIYEADRSLAADGREPERFRLHHSGGMQSEIEHPRWDPSWATPSEYTIDDLEEFGYLRVEPHHNKVRSFVLTLKGRQKGAELAAGARPSQPVAVPPGRPGSYSDEERLRYIEQADAQLELATSSFLGRVGSETFTEEDLVEAVQMPKFDISAAVQWLRNAHSEGLVAPAGGGWQLIPDTAGPTYHVQVVPTKAEDRLAGPIYALDLAEGQVLSSFVAPYQKKEPITWGDRTFTAYRKPKIGRLNKSGTKIVKEISENLAASRRVHSANEAEELFFEKTVQEVTDNYIDPSEPPLVDSTERVIKATARSMADGEIFIVHGHSRKNLVARTLEHMTGRKPIILSEQPGRGQTIIQKFEAHAGSAAFAVVLLTADDVGAAKDKREDLQPRARQNVVLELGYFLGKIGRENVAVLYEDDVELPSDYVGVEYISFADEWRLKLMAELTAAGLEVKAPLLDAG